MGRPWWETTEQTHSGAVHGRKSISWLCKRPDSVLWFAGHKVPVLSFYLALLWSTKAAIDHEFVYPSKILFTKTDSQSIHYSLVCYSTEWEGVDQSSNADEYHVSQPGSHRNADSGEYYTILSMFRTGKLKQGANTGSWNAELSSQVFDLGRFTMVSVSGSPVFLLNRKQSRASYSCYVGKTGHSNERPSHTAAVKSVSPAASPSPHLSLNRTLPLPSCTQHRDSRRWLSYRGGRKAAGRRAQRPWNKTPHFNIICWRPYRIQSSTGSWEGHWSWLWLQVVTTLKFMRLSKDWSKSIFISTASNLHRAGNFDFSSKKQTWLRLVLTSKPAYFQQLLYLEFISPLSVLMHVTMFKLNTVISQVVSKWVGEAEIMQKPGTTDHRPHGAKTSHSSGGLSRGKWKGEDSMPGRDWSLFSLLQKRTPAGDYNTLEAGPGGPSSWTSVWMWKLGALTICCPPLQQAFRWSRRPSLHGCHPPPCLPRPHPRNAPISRKTKTLRKLAKCTTPKLLPLHPISFDLVSSEGFRDTENLYSIQLCFSCFSTFQYRRSLSHEHCSW